MTALLAYLLGVASVLVAIHLRRSADRARLRFLTGEYRGEQDAELRAWARGKRRAAGCTPLGWRRA